MVIEDSHLESKNKEIRDKAFEIMEKGIILAQKLGVRVIQLATYDVYYEESDEETKALFLEGMKKSVEMASHAGSDPLQWKSWIRHLLERFFVQCTISKSVPHILKIYPDMKSDTDFQRMLSEFELGISETVAIHVKRQILEYLNVFHLEKEP